MKKHPTKREPSKAVKAAAKMPPLRHNLGDPFDIRKSEVLKWLFEQPEVMRANFDYYRENGAIVFDQESKTWKGRDL